MNTKKILLFLFFSAMLSSVIIKAQNKAAIKPIIETARKSYPIDGTPLLSKQYENVAAYLKLNPDALKRKTMQKTSWSFAVGSTKTWWSIDMTTGLYYQVQSTCRAVNNYSYVFVENSDWGMTVNQAAVDSVSKAFDSSTPADPTKGIYQTDVDDFGTPPDVDGDPKIIILILDIKDGFSGSGGYIAGYFNPANEVNQPSSNKAEIYYVDCNPTDLTTQAGITLAMGTTAHEFQHMINWNYHQTNPELTFINEGLSQQATDNCGYPLDFDSYSNDENKFLYSWGSTNDVLNDYSRAARYFVYLKNQFGIGLSKRIVQDSVVGVAGLQNALTNYGVTESLNQIFVNWCIANAVNDKGINSSFGYDNPSISKVGGVNVTNPFATADNQSVNNTALSSLNFTIGNSLKVLFNSTSNLNIKAIERSNNSVKIADVPIGQQFTEPLFGSTYQAIQFLVIDTSMTNTALYSYKSSVDVSGETELKWDVNEPIGYYVLTTSDTQCVIFNGVQGAVLDSIKIALRRPGSIRGGVWQFSGDPLSILGTPLAEPITATIATETPVPYPVPFQNWTSVDLTSYSIKTDSAFVVGFVVGKVPNTPGVMVSYYPGTSAYYNYTYLQTTDNVSSPGWYYFQNPTADSVAVYLIRAYVHYIATGVSKEIELMPSRFNVAQNYPNPFNPSTIISYSIPKADNVEVGIYNMLGQKVETLVNKFQQAGNYKIDFKANNLPSGVYIYSVRYGNMEQSKKMVFLK